jgi:hypothetical protein
MWQEIKAGLGYRIITVRSRTPNHVFRSRNTNAAVHNMVDWAAAVKFYDLVPPPARFELKKNRARAKILGYSALQKSDHAFSDFRGPDCKNVTSTYLVL